VDLMGFGNNAISTSDNLYIQNVAARAKYIDALLRERKLPVRIGVADDYKKYCRPVALRLPYHGSVNKSRIEWQRIPGDILERLIELMDVGFIEETDDEFCLTHKGWRWYSNLMYYLSPQDEREAIDGYINRQLQLAGRESWPVHMES
jgi:oxygen-independent coproporphyrinogen-3 oxidase